jgi:hypothetical protein
VIFRELIKAVLVIDLLDGKQLLLCLQRREKSRSSRQRRTQPIFLIAWVIEAQIVVDDLGDRTLDELGEDTIRFSCKSNHDSLLSLAESASSTLGACVPSIKERDYQPHVDQERTEDFFLT